MVQGDSNSWCWNLKNDHTKIHRDFLLNGEEHSHKFVLTIPHRNNDDCFLWVRLFFRGISGRPKKNDATSTLYEMRKLQFSESMGKGEI